MWRMEILFWGGCGEVCIREGRKDGVERKGDVTGVTWCGGSS